MEDIKFVDTKKRTLFFCGKPRPFKNPKMSEIEKFNEELMDLNNENKKHEHKITVLENKLKETNNLEDYEKIEKEIAKTKKNIMSTTELNKKVSIMAILMLDDLTEKEFLENREIQDSDLVYGLPQILKLILARTDEVKCNKFVREFLENAVNKSIKSFQ